MVAALQVIGVDPHTAVYVIVNGNPLPTQRPRENFHTPKKSIDAQRRVAHEFHRVQQRFTAGVGMVITFYRSGKQVVDVDNLEKTVLDGMSMTEIWNDDSQVTATCKFLEVDPEWPRTEIAIGPRRSTMERKSWS